MACLRLLGITCTVAACSTGGGTGSPRDLALATGGDLSIPSGTHCVVHGGATRLSTLPGHHGPPRLTFTGDGYVVAWNTRLAGGGLNSHRIDVALTDAEGRRLGPNLPITTAPVADPSTPSVATLRGGTVVAWSRITMSG